MRVFVLFVILSIVILPCLGANPHRSRHGSKHHRHHRRHPMKIGELADRIISSEVRSSHEKHQTTHIKHMNVANNADYTSKRLTRLPNLVEIEDIPYAPRPGDPQEKWDEFNKRYQDFMNAASNQRAVLANMVAQSDTALNGGAPSEHHSEEAKAISSSADGPQGPVRVTGKGYALAGGDDMEKVMTPSSLSSELAAMKTLSNALSRVDSKTALQQEALLASMAKQTSDMQQQQQARLVQQKVFVAQQLARAPDPEPVATTAPVQPPPQQVVSTPIPTQVITASPTQSPTPTPTVSPTPAPSVAPTKAPTPSPTPNPTPSPTESPTASPTPVATHAATPVATAAATSAPQHPAPTTTPEPARPIATPAANVSVVVQKPIATQAPFDVLDKENDDDNEGVEAEQALPYSPEPLIRPVIVDPEEINDRNSPNYNNNKPIFARTERELEAIVNNKKPVVTNDGGHVSPVIDYYVN